MITSAYCVFDRKALIYSPPFYAHNDQVAMRTLRDAVADPNSNLGRHSADFVLYRAGVFNDQTGVLSAEMPLAHVIDVIALVPETTAPLFDSHP